MRTTHTYALLAVSRPTYDEIHGKLVAADYGHAFIEQEGSQPHIDMHGIALCPEEVPQAARRRALLEQAIDRLIALEALAETLLERVGILLMVQRLRAIREKDAGVLQGNLGGEGPSS